MNSKIYLTALYPSSKDIYLYHNFGKKGVTKGRHHFEPHT